jgi:hypothetical protein
VFLYACILLRNRHLPFLDPTLIVMKEGPANNRLLFHFAASDCRPSANLDCARPSQREIGQPAPALSFPD